MGVLVCKPMSMTHKVWEYDSAVKKCQNVRLVKKSDCRTRFHVNVWSMPPKISNIEEILCGILKFLRCFYFKEFFDPFKIFQDHLNSSLDDLRFWTRRQMRRNDLDKWVFDNFWRVTISEWSTKRLTNQKVLKRTKIT